MCGPLGVLGTVLVGAGSVYAGYQQQKAGLAQAQAYESQKAAADANAQMQMAQAEDASARGRQEASDYRKKMMQVAASQRAAAGASGVETYSGSANLLYDDTELQKDTNIERILVNAGRERAGYESQYVSSRNQANNYGMMAQQARKSSKYGLFNGLLNAATSAFSFG